MNCQNFETIVTELARQQMMEAQVRELALAHADECTACAMSLSDERALTQKLRALAMDMSSVAAPQGIENELIAAFRKQKFTQSRPAANRAWHYRASAVAAVLLIAVGVGVLSVRSMILSAQDPYIPPFQPKITANLNNERVSIDQPVPSTVDIKSDGYSKRQTKPSWRPSVAEKRNQGERLRADSESAVAANYGGNEVATDFMPIGYTSPMNLQDGGQVMRVELPRSTLAGFGLPVNMDRVNERVKADVLVGPDGMARAIRFVQ